MISTAIANRKVTYIAGVATSGISGIGAISSNQINQIVTTGAGATVSLLVGMSVIGGPVGMAAGALIAVGSLIASMFHGCGQTCVMATQDANKIGDLQNQNLNAYMSSPIHYRSLQLAALNNFDTLVAALRQACSDPQLGDAGKRCISERLVEGGTAPWCPSSNHKGCDYYATFRYPIANDPHVVPDPSPISNVTDGVVGGVQSTISNLANSSSFGIPTLLLIGIGLLGLGVISSGSNK